MCTRCEFGWAQYELWYAKKLIRDRLLSARTEAGGNPVMLMFVVTTSTHIPSRPNEDRRSLSLAVNGEMEVNIIHLFTIIQSTVIIMQTLEWIAVKN